MTYAETYRRLVFPELLEECRLAAFLIDMGRWHFNQGFDHVFSMARERGALLLPEPVLTDLEEMIAVKIAEAIDADDFDDVLTRLCGDGDMAVFREDRGEG